MTDSSGRRCPHCGRAVTARGPQDSSAFPFCSPRCQMVDLGKWFREEYRTSRPVIDDDELTD